MNKLTTGLVGLIATGVLVAGCGSSQTGAPSAAPTSNVFLATSSTTTTTAPPTTTTIDATLIAMQAWAASHKSDMTHVNDALNKVSDIAGQISTEAGNSVDNFAATNDGNALSASADRVLALVASEKRACSVLATTIKVAQAGLPVPEPTVNDPYSSTLDHYLSAARACEVGHTTEAASEIRAGNAALEDTTQALKDYVG
jgi:hypothetical protein